MDLRYFCSNFPDILPKILSILLNYERIVNNSTVNFMFKDKKELLTVFI